MGERRERGGDGDGMGINWCLAFTTQMAKRATFCNRRAILHH